MQARARGRARPAARVRTDAGLGERPDRVVNRPAGRRSAVGQPGQQVIPVLLSLSVPSPSSRRLIRSGSGATMSRGRGHLPARATTPRRSRPDRVCSEFHSFGLWCSPFSHVAFGQCRLRANCGRLPTGTILRPSARGGGGCTGNPATVHSSAKGQTDGKRRKSREPDGYENPYETCKCLVLRRAPPVRRPYDGLDRSSLPVFPPADDAAGDAL